MKKILILNDIVSGGGVEKVMEIIAKHLDRSEYDITIATLFSDRKNIRRIYGEDMKYITYGRTMKESKFCDNKILFFFYRFYRKARKIYAKYKLSGKFDIILALKECECMFEAEKLQAPKKFAWVHADYNAVYWTKTLFGSAEKEIECMKGFDKVICVSEAVKESVCRVIGDPKNLVVKYNPISSDEIVQKSQEKIERLQKTLLVTVGRLSKLKGYDRLLNCCALLREYDFELWIVGGGELKTELLRQKETLKLDNVSFLGEKENPYPYIRCADWYISSSISESYGISIQEARILDVPVVTTDFPALREFFTDKDGIICENSESGLLSAMKIALNSADKTKFPSEGRSQKIMLTDRMNEIEKLWKD